MRFNSIKIPPLSKPLLVISFIVAAIIIFLSALVFNLGKNEENMKINEKKLNNLVQSYKKEANELRSQDQYQINKKLEEEIGNINKTYKKAVTTYEGISDLSLSSKNSNELTRQFASVLSLLSEKNYASAQASLISLDAKIKTEKDRIAALSLGSVSLENLKQSNTPPGSGYSRQRVDALGSSYAVDIVAGDLSSTRVIVDTASDSDCKDNCPVLSLGDYVGRNGAYAGINGSYFCPASYPSCAGKTNSYDTLAMNKNKTYFNSDNNVYSTVPAVIFGGGWVRFVGRSLDWGRDTGVDGVLANQPLLVSGGQAVFGGDGDPKKGSKGSRSFVANKGNTVYIGVVHNVTVTESSQVLKAMGMDNALNLDSGGSTALWSGGYKAGPGRNIPNAILFVRK